MPEDMATATRRTYLRGGRLQGLHAMTKSATITLRPREIRFLEALLRNVEDRASVSALMATPTRRLATRLRRRIQAARIDIVRGRTV